MSQVMNAFSKVDRTRLAAILREHSELPWSGVLSSEATAALHLDAWTSRGADAIIAGGDQHLSAIVLEELQWDTKILGLKCARITPIGSPQRLPNNFMEADREMIGALVQELREREIQLADCKIATTDLFLVRAFEEAGFHLVDMLVTMSMDKKKVASVVERSGERIERLDEQRIKVDGSVVVRPLEVRDLPSMLRLAREAFSDTAEIKDRFFLEPRIDHERACDLFHEWFKNAVRKQQRGEGEVLVAALDDVACGFVTMNAPAHGTGYWQDSLNAILPEARGKGVFRALVLGSIHYVAMRESALLTRTQISTRRVINTWLHMGADLTESFFTLHFTP